MEGSPRLWEMASSPNLASGRGWEAESRRPDRWCIMLTDDMENRITQLLVRALSPTKRGGLHNELKVEGC